jgi:hypothetical protein
MEIVFYQVTWTVKVMECVIDPLVAVTVTVYVPNGILWPALTLKVTLPDPPEVNSIDELLSEDWRRLDESVIERVTVPLKPLRLVSVI